MLGRYDDTRIASLRYWMEHFVAPPPGPYERVPDDSVFKWMGILSDFGVDVVNAAEAGRLADFFDPICADSVSGF